MNVDIESLGYNPPYKVELRDRNTQFTPEGTSIQNIFAISDYGYHREVVKILTGGVSINNPKFRVYPKQDSYFNEYCYCLDCDVKSIEPDAFSGKTSMQSEAITDDWVEAHQRANVGDIRRYSPVMWWSKHVPAGGAVVAANYRSIRGYYLENGHLNFDFVEPQIVFQGNAVSVDSWDLGWRYDGETPGWWALNTDTVGYVSECILGFSVKRIMVPDFQYKILSNFIIPANIGKINTLTLDLPIAEHRGPSGIHYRFPPECVRFDNCEATPHMDAYGAVYWTLDYQFSVNYNLGAPRSGFEGVPIGWNALYNPRIRDGLRIEHSGWMRVSTAPGWWDIHVDEDNPWFGAFLPVPRQNHSLYLTTGGFPQLFMNYD